MAIKANELKTKIKGAILEVTLNRPKANAIDLLTSQRMGEIFMEFRDNSKLRVAISVSYTHLTLPTSDLV